MPRLDAFPAVSQGWINQVTAVSTAALKDGIEAGANFMRETIMDSPTGTPWHLDKNRSNSFPLGARIGNANPNFGTQGVDPNSGLMLSSVSQSGPTSARNVLKGSFGWIDVKENYFLLQDVGNYVVGEQSGMGLLNNTERENNSITQMGAAFEAERVLAKAMLSAGFKYTGSEF